MNILVNNQVRLFNWFKKVLPAQLRCFIIAAILLVPCIFISSKLQSQKVLFYVSLYCTGFILWTYFEYHFHRFLMHDEKFKVPLEPFTKHVYHHSHPAEIIITQKVRVICIILESLFMLLAVLLNNYFTVFCGFFCGLISYFFIHYFLHQEKSYKIVPWLVRNHIFHHTKYANRCFGITTRFWDKVNNTTQPKGALILDKTLKLFYLKKTERARLQR